jgi:hypothetical protein
VQGAALLKTYVIVRAQTGDFGEFLTSKAIDAAPRRRRQADVLWGDHGAPCS